MTDLMTALALVFVIEGLLYAIAPDGMKEMAAIALETPAGYLRLAGLVAMTVGVGIVWVIRG
ncbi:DUF2065 domain-containing protein [Rhodospirillum centenum]|uniref:DUF2065 domain-containing protein n=1 Tax=Rhodospirillum centenum (strain ATCC 51521 / SW) TaxID=414684 RepID=B6INV5_RHOCS|nr:DUF2065 domain-containing protein [Rhodospirillum centenum]ACI99375.1 conserved hypothetical protein [Rhodospirillum centenum SW]